MYFHFNYLKYSTFFLSISRAEKINLLNVLTNDQAHSDVYHKHNLNPLRCYFPTAVYVSTISVPLK